ncbi:hypothetical protein [Streptomyces viridochromogenes]|uniref:hypothetical protein n=1 Tax=Streptomyces viridochromogenes TaxID=1938 RepID=UPI000AE247DE|nr:hypothetical protein [Streptomyces viridochromogenes]
MLRRPLRSSSQDSQGSRSQDGFDLYHDLQTGALTLRRLGEDLHVAAERMRALALPQRRSWQEAVAAYYGTARIPPAMPPPSARPDSRAP